MISSATEDRDDEEGREATSTHESARYVLVGPRFRVRRCRVMAGDVCHAEDKGKSGIEEDVPSECCLADDSPAADTMVFASGEVSPLGRDSGSWSGLCCCMMVLMNRNTETQRRNRPAECSHGCSSRVRRLVGSGGVGAQVDQARLRFFVWRC